MIKLSSDRPELAPDTRSFNIVFDALAKSRENNCEKRAEALLEEMEELSSGVDALKCKPDQVVSDMSIPIVRLFSK